MSKVVWRKLHARTENKLIKWLPEHKPTTILKSSIAKKIKTKIRKKKTCKRGTHVANPEHTKKPNKSVFDAHSQSVIWRQKASSFRLSRVQQWNSQVGKYFVKKPHIVEGSKAEWILPLLVRSLHLFCSLSLIYFCLSTSGEINYN